MRNTANRLTALLTVLGAVTLSAKANVTDSLYDASMLKVFSVKAEKQVRMIFASQNSKPTYVQLYNEEDQLLHRERVAAGDFVRNYDLSLAPAGEYTFVVGSGREKIERVIELGFEGADSMAVGVDLKKALFVLTTTDRDQYALVGKNESGAKLKYHIYDQAGERIYAGSVKNNSEVKALFNFKQVDKQEVTFKFFVEGQLIKEKLVDL